MSAGVAERVRDYFAGRAMTHVTDLRVTRPVEVRIRELIAAGGVPILYANHQSHADGMALAVISGYLRKLASRNPNDYQLRGLVIPIAASMASGDQSQELKETYDSLKGGAFRKGFEGFPITRRKDQQQFGMSRAKIITELRPFINRLEKGYGIAILPEGTVQGGRHREGEDIEQIYGMQEVQEDSLIDFFQLIKRVLGEGRKPFYMPVSLHGGFRILQSPQEVDKPKPTLTRKGRISIYLGVIGLSLLKIRTNLLRPFTEDEIVADLGSNWRKNGPIFNRYAMTKIAPFLPPVARGVYADSQSIELPVSS